MRISRSNFSVATTAGSAAMADRHDPVLADEDVWAEDAAIPDQAVQHPQSSAESAEAVVSPLSYAPAIITESAPVKPAALITADSISYPLRSKQMSNNFAVKHWMDQDRTVRNAQSEEAAAKSTAPVTQVADVVVPVAAAESTEKPVASVSSPKPANPSMIMSGQHTAYQGLSVREQFGSGEKVWKNAFTLAENVRFTRTPENELMKLRAKLIEEFGGEQETVQPVAMTIAGETTPLTQSVTAMQPRVAAPVLRGPSSVIVAARLRLPQVPVPPKVEAALPLATLVKVPDAEVVVSEILQVVAGTVPVAASVDIPSEQGLQLSYLSDSAFWELADTEFAPAPAPVPVLGMGMEPDAEPIRAAMMADVVQEPVIIALPEAAAPVSSILNLFRTVECRPFDELPVPDMIAGIASEASSEAVSSVVETTESNIAIDIAPVAVVVEEAEIAPVAETVSTHSAPLSAHPFISPFSTGFGSYQFNAQAQFASSFLSATAVPTSVLISAQTPAQAEQSELVQVTTAAEAEVAIIAEVVPKAEEQELSPEVVIQPVVEAAAHDATPRSFAGIVAPAVGMPRTNSTALNLSIFSPTVTEAGTAFSPFDYQYPPRELLQEPVYKDGAIISQEMLQRSAGLLESILEDFGVRGEIIHVRPGPVVTLYEFEPAPGVKSSRVIGLADDIARSMSALSARVAVVPGRNVIGIELPNSIRETVYFRELIESPAFESTAHRLALCLGKTIGGEPVVAELAKMPHLLVAGTTGSGKSVAINTMILSLLYRLKPEECRMIMIDPKMLELSIYDGIPHLLTPVVTDPKKAVVALKWTVREMEDRYRKMSRLGVRNIDGYNARAASAREKGETVTCTVQAGFDKASGEILYEEQEMDLTPMPYIVVIVDEMADLMMVAGKEIEGAIQRLAQMARAAGIHLIMATQRPSVDVITGTIKANFPTRISFQVTSKIDSRTILGEQGAEQLLGQGDMLHMVGGGRIVRVHGPFVSDEEVEKVVTHLKGQGRPDYLSTVTADEDDQEAAEEDSAVFDKGDIASDDGDDLYDKAIKVVLRDKKCSTSYIQRRLSIGYNRAASLVERMEQDGLVGAANHVGKREILGQRDGE